MLEVFAVLDKKAAAYGTPMFVTTVGLATRGFEDACQNPQGPLVQHAEDYSLHHIGSYDPNSGELKSLPLPKFVISAIQVRENLKRKMLQTAPELPGVEDKEPA